METDFIDRAKDILNIIDYINYDMPSEGYNIDLISQLFFTMFGDILTDYQLDNITYGERLNEDGEFTELFHKLSESIYTSREKFREIIIEYLIKYDRFEILLIMRELEKQKEDHN